MRREEGDTLQDFAPSLILVEGMPGTGKSTVSQHVVRQLRLAGRSARWWHEERVDFPVRLFFDPQRHRSWSDYADEAVTCWRHYASTLGEDETVVMDAAVLQNHVRSLLMRDGDRSGIEDLVGRIGAVIASRHPAWIYLRPDDVEANFQAVTAARGRRLLDLWVQAHDQSPCAAHGVGYAGFVGFWREFRQISDRIFDSLTMTKSQHRVPGENESARSTRVLEFLGLPAPSFPATPLEPFVGNYGAEDGEAEFSIESRESHLVVRCEQPTMDVNLGPLGCFRELRLLPVGATRFDVEAWPHQAVFQQDDQDHVEGLTVESTQDGWPVPGRMCRRLR